MDTASAGLGVPPPLPTSTTGLRRYGSADALETPFGITDNDLYDWLEQRGFRSSAAKPSTVRPIPRRVTQHEVSGPSHREVGSCERRPDTSPRDAARSREVKEFSSEGLPLLPHPDRGSTDGVHPLIADENLTSTRPSEFESVLRDTTMPCPALGRSWARRPGERSRTSRRTGLIRVPPAPPPGVGAGTQVRLRAILLPPDPYVFRAGWLEIHGGGGPPQGGGRAVPRPARLHERKHQGLS